MNRRISHGQAIRSVLGRARVTQFMAAPCSWLLLAGVDNGAAGRDGTQRVEVEVAAGGVVAGDRPEVAAWWTGEAVSRSRSGVLVQASKAAWDAHAVTATASTTCSAPTAPGAPAPAAAARAGGGWEALGGFWRGERPRTSSNTMPWRSRTVRLASIHMLKRSRSA